MRDMVRKAHVKNLAVLPMGDASSTSDLDFTDQGDDRSGEEEGSVTRSPRVSDSPVPVVGESACG